MDPCSTHIYMSEARLLQRRQLSPEVDPVCRDTDIAHPVQGAERSNNIGKIFPDKRLLNEEYFISAVANRGRAAVSVIGLQLGFSFHVRKRRLCTILQAPYLILRLVIYAFQADTTNTFTLPLKLCNTRAAWSYFSQCTTPSYARPALIRTCAMRLLYQPRINEYDLSSPTRANHGCLCDTARRYGSNGTASRYFATPRSRSSRLLRNIFRLRVHGSETKVAMIHQ